MNLSSRQIVEILGVLAVVLSLLFVGYELRLARSIAETESLFQTSEETRNLHEYISSNADVWAKGCMGEDLSATEAIVYFNTVKSAMEHQFFRWCG